MKQPELQRCSYRKCQHPALFPFKKCQLHLEQARRNRNNWRANLPPKSCRECRRAALSKTKCAVCLARRRELKLPTLKHDRNAHAKMLILAKHHRSRCARTGLTLHILMRMGHWLEVDRIDSGRGYTTDNMQLLASELNKVKGAIDIIPISAVKWLMSRIDRMAYEPYSAQEAPYPT